MPSSGSFGERAIALVRSYKHDLDTNQALLLGLRRERASRRCLVVVLPLTTRRKGIPLHVAIEPPEGGVRTQSFVKPEDIRAISVERLGKRWGVVSPATLGAVEERLRVLLEL